MYCFKWSDIVDEYVFLFPPSLLPRFIRCKDNLSLISLQCDFCLRRFCLAHHQAELHGCGDVAKKAARQQSQKEWREALSSSSRSEKSREAHRVQLQQKLKGQIGQMEGKRTRSAQAKKWRTPMYGLAYCLNVYTNPGDQHRNIHTESNPFIQITLPPFCIIHVILYLYCTYSLHRTYIHIVYVHYLN